MFDRKKYNKEYSFRNREKIAEYMRKYRASHPNYRKREVELAKRRKSRSKGETKDV